MFLHKAHQARAANFLLTFDEKRDVHRQRRARLQIGLYSFYMRKELALVVRRAASEQFTAALDRVEWRCVPQFKWLGRLHIIMPVNEDVWRGSAGCSRFCDENRVSLGRAQLHIQAERAKVACQPVGASEYVASVIGLSRNTWETHQSFQLVDKLASILR